MRRKHDADTDGMEGVAKRLREERPEASPLELDQIKTSAMSRAKSGAGGRVGTRRLAVAGLTVGLLLATTGGVLAGKGDHGHGHGNKGGNEGGNAANAQYGGECNIGNGNGNVGNKNGAGAENNACNENIFITNNNNSGGTTINNYYTTVSATPAATGGVQGSTTTKKAKTSSRHIKIHVKVPHGLKLRRVTVKVNGKSVKTLVGKKASANIELVNLPCSTGKTTVVITVKLSNGKTVTSSHKYELCTS
jgi:hypothetical protein